MTPIHDSTVARIAGNIASGLLTAKCPDGSDTDTIIEIAVDSVALARAIVAEVERGEKETVAESGQAYAKWSRAKVADLERQLEAARKPDGTMVFAAPGYVGELTTRISDLERQLTEAQQKAEN
jgi:hypothetical protein